MSNQGPAPSPLPPSMGPGARPVQPGQSAPGQALRELMEIRKTYHVTADTNHLNLSYDLNGRTRRYAIPFENMPIGKLAQRFLFNPSGTKISGIFVTDAIRGAENVIGQQLSQTEAEGFAKHAVKRLEYGLWGNLIGLSGGYGVAYMGRKEMKFPLMKPKDPIRYTNFPNRYIPILTGSWARLAWQMTRANVYALIALAVSGPLFGSMGDISMMAGLYRDGRTQEVVKKMKEKISSPGFDRIGVNTQRPGQPAPQPQTQSDADDMNPQDTDSSSNYGGIDPYAGDGAFTDSPTEPESMSGSMADPAQAQQLSAQPRHPFKQQTQSQPRPQQPSSSSSDFFFDDASPIAGNDPNMSTPAPNGYNQNRNTRGGVWASIRRGNSNSNTGANNNQSMNGYEQHQQQQQQGQSQQQTRDGMGMGGDNSFSFSNSDREREVARQQAQKEFDAMLERERKESGSGDYGRGMQAAAGGREQSGTGDGGGSGGGDGESVWERRRRGG